MKQPPVECEAVFDRLGPALLAQAYQLLVPEHRGSRSSSRQSGKDRADGPAAIYARVSSARQTKEQTIASQTAALLTHAAEQGLEVPAEWVFQDEGYSGATLVRPALERLRDLVAQVPVDVVVCHAPDRLARRYAYQALLIEELGRAGTEVRLSTARSVIAPRTSCWCSSRG